MYRSLMILALLCIISTDAFTQEDPPEINIDPSRFDENLMMGEIYELTMMIDNSGDDPLIWDSHLDIRRTGETKNGPRRDEPGDILDFTEEVYEKTNGLAFDGELMWGIVYEENKLIALDPQRDELVHEYDLPISPVGLTIVNNELWTMHWSTRDIYRYAKDGEALGIVDIPSVQAFGLACIDDEYLLRNITRDRIIEVFSLRTGEETAEIDIAAATDSSSTGSLTWVKSHEEGQLWCLGESSAFQIFIDNEWNAEQVQAFSTENVRLTDGIAHDLKDLWHGVRNEAKWYIVDDGIEERFWVEYEPTSGTIEGGDWTDVFIYIRSVVLPPGYHSTSIIFESNDPDTPFVRMFITLKVFNQPNHFRNIQHTPYNHTIRVERLAYMRHVVQTGWEIGIFTEDGILAGSTVWAQNMAGSTVLSVFGDDPETDEIEGFVEDEEMTFRIWDETEQRELRNLPDEFDISVGVISGSLEWQDGGETTVRIDCAPAQSVRDLTPSPSAFILHEPYPNPFNSATTISYTLPTPGTVSLSIYNPQGRKVLTRDLGSNSVGLHTTALDMTDMPTGLYFTKLEALGTLRTQKIMLIR